ncbi:hypothetical protein N7470_003050 [Penicillium chermesinum]|nr:hypothetical protein N7470_003050 [Penicillium chermesinum]
MADYDNDNGRYADEPRYERDRSASPRDEPRGDRARSRSPNGRSDDREDEEGAQNPGSNLFVTGIHPRLTESDISRLFEKYGDVDNCSIMLDPHTKESRGFGFVNMTTPEQADAAKEGLQGEVIEGRTLSIEKARRSRPHGRGPPRRGDRYDERRGPGGGGNWRRRDDDYYRYGRYDSYNDRRDYGRDYNRGGGDYRSRDYGGRDYRRDSRDDYGYRGGGGGGGGGGGPDRYSDRYSRDDRRGDDRRGGGGSGNGGDEGGRGYYDRDANAGSYDAAPPREPREPYSSGGGGGGGGGRSYEGRGGEERYGSR